MSTHARAVVCVVSATTLLVGVYLLLPKPPADVPHPRAHADHMPRNGGIFFMAPNGFHHLEGTVNNGEFRLYFYDNITQPLDARPFRARIDNRWLVPASDGQYLAVALDTVTANPVHITAFVRFRPDRPEDRFDFTFPLPPPIPQ